MSTSPEPGHRTSLTLLHRLRGNEADAWDRLLRLYGPLVRHWCARSGLRPEDADDVSQEVFKTVAGSLDGFRRDRPGDSFRGWLRGITRNKVLHFLRDNRDPRPDGGTDAQRRLQSLPDETPPPAEEEDDPVSELNALYRRGLELVRSEFEERTWQAFWLTAVEGRPAGDVAADLNVSPAAVRKAKSRVLHRLKEELGDLIE